MCAGNRRHGLEFHEPSISPTLAKAADSSPPVIESDRRNKMTAMWLVVGGGQDGEGSWLGMRRGRS